MPFNVERNAGVVNSFRAANAAAQPSADPRESVPVIKCSSLGMSPAKGFKNLARGHHGGER